MGIDQKSREILDAALARKQTVLVSSSGLDITFQSFVLAVESDHLLLQNRIPPKYIRAFAAGDRFGLQAGMVRFQSDAIRSDGEHIVFPLKEDSVIEETRQAERFAFNADERVVAEILNPFDEETCISKSVMDMSATGLSLRTILESKLFKPDTQLPSIRVLIGGELYMQATGRIVYRRKLMDLSGQMRLQVGIKFDP